MEVNVRMPRNNMLAFASGVNFPWIIYMDLVENKQIEVNSYRRNVYWIELYTDVYNSLFNANKENYTLLDYIKPYLTNKKVFAVFSIKDIILEFALELDDRKTNFHSQNVKMWHKVLTHGITPEEFLEELSVYVEQGV